MKDKDGGNSRKVCWPTMGVLQMANGRIDRSSTLDVETARFRYQTSEKGGF